MRRTSLLALVAVVSTAACSPGAASSSATSPTASAPPATSTTPSQQSASAGVATPAPGADCSSDFTPQPLPTWARAGFTPPSHPMPYVLGDDEDIVAILWVTHDPLVVPPLKSRSNKILWVSRVVRADGFPLTIRATLLDSGQSVTREVAGGPGPSIIDLPAAGCWSFDLTWGNQHDHLDLRYVRS